MIASVQRPVVIVGAGIAGLAAAYELAQRGLPHFLVLDAAARPGGAILSETKEGFLLEAGPDSFLAAKPAAANLCCSLGLVADLTRCAAASPRTWILHHGRLQPLPEAWQFLAPARLAPALRSPLFSWPAKLRLAREFFAPVAADAAADISVAAWARAHLGPEILATLVAPLLAGVYGGDPEALSFSATLPRFATLAARGNLLRALSRQHAAQPSAAPSFLTLRGGLSQLANALATVLGDRLRLGRPVAAISATSGGGYLLRLADGTDLFAAAVIVATPAWAAAKLLLPLDPELAAVLAAIPYSSAATVHLAYPQAPPWPSGFGFLVPRAEGHRLLAATFVQQKFPHRAPPAAALLRLFYGGALDPAAACLPAAELVALAQQEAAAILGSAPIPAWVRVHYWPQSMPQYTVGHAARFARITAALSRHPGLALAGSAFQGVGLPDAIASGQAAARLFTADS